MKHFAALNEGEMLEWIATAAYPELLRKWRHEQLDSPWFKGAVGKAYRLRMQVCRNGLTIQEAVDISHQVGWTQSTNFRDLEREYL